MAEPGVWLEWTRRQMPLTRAECEALPDLTGKRLALSVHLDLKMVPALEALLERGCALFLTTCNPSTVRDEVVERLRERGAEGFVWRGMSAADWEEGVQRALDWAPRYTCEMGADLSAAAHARAETSIRAGLEATGSGIGRLSSLALRYPVYNWDDLPVKEGLHNRYLVGLSLWQTFMARTWLSLHGKRVVVVGFGLVGQGVAEAARAFGGTVTVVERDPARRLEASYAGWPVADLGEAAARADVLVTATGVPGVIGRETLAKTREGCFLLNVGHVADEIDVGALEGREPVLPFVEGCHAGGRPLYLFAGGSMANLTAGFGDSLNAFDLTLAIMVAGLRFLLTDDYEPRPGLYPLPKEVWQEVARRA